MKIGRSISTQIAAHAVLTKTHGVATAIQDTSPLTIHALATTAIHGVGGSYLAKTGQSDQIPHIEDLDGAVCSETELAARVPSGLIVMWHGTIANIPAGWLICDGNNGTPNLLDKFIEGVATAATDPGATGGEATHTLSIAEMPAHTHLTEGIETRVLGSTRFELCKPGANPSQLATLSAGGDSAHENKPPFYDVAFLMKT